MSNLGDLIETVDDVIPPSVFNAKTIWVTDGDSAVSHDYDTNPLGAVVIRDPGSSGLLTDHMYIRNTENSALVDVFKNHTHVSSSDGGSEYEIKKANAKDILELNFQNLRKAQFVNVLTPDDGSSNATITDEVDSTTAYVELYSPIDTDYADMMAGGLRLHYGKPFLLQAKYKVFENDNILWRIGTGMSSIGNSGNQAQVGFEGCGTEDNITVISANGEDRSPDMLSDMLNANPLGLRLEYYPNDRIIAYDGTGAMTNKTDNLPSTSSATAANSTFRIGLKSTHDSSGEERAMRVYAAYLVGHIYDSESGVGAWV